jgi:hypothetical protein
MNIQPARATATLIGIVVLGLSVSPALFEASVRAQDASAPCVALMLPTVQGVSGNAEDVASGVRDLIAKYLTGPSLKVISLESRLPSQATVEAKQKGCEPILVTWLTRKSGGGGLARALGQAAGTSSYYVPGGGTIASATARAATVAGLQTASSLAGTTKAKDEMRLEYKLLTVSGQVQFGPKTESQKASADGEDLLTPIVTRAAEAIVTRKSVK